MGLSYDEGTGNGVQTVFPFSFAGEAPGYLSTDQIYVYVDNEEVAISGFPTEGSVELVDAPPAPDVALQPNVLIRRIVDKEKPYSDYARGNIFSEHVLNFTFRQQLYALHEQLDGFLEEGYFVKGNWEMKGYKILNVGDGEDLTDAINLGQLTEVYDELDGRVDDTELASASADAALASEIAAQGYATNASASATSASNFADASEASAIASAASAAEALATEGRIVAEGDTQVQRVIDHGTYYETSIAIAGAGQLAYIEAEGDSQVARVEAEGDTQVARLDAIVESADLNKSVRQTMLTGPDLEATQGTVETSATVSGDIRNTYHDLDTDMLTGSRGGMTLLKAKESVDHNYLASSLLSDYLTLYTNDTSIGVTWDNGVKQLSSSGVEMGSSGVYDQGNLYTFQTNRDEVIDGNRWQWNDESGFFMCLYEGTSVDRELTHPMGKEILFLAIKNQDRVVDWTTGRYGTDEFMVLNSTDEEVYGVNKFVDVHTASYISLGAGNNVNATGEMHFMFGWAGDPLDDLHAGMRGKRGVTASYIQSSVSATVDTGITDIQAIIYKSIDGNGSEWNILNKASGFGNRTRLSTTAAEDTQGIVTVSGSEVTMASQSEQQLVIVIGSTADAPDNKRKNGVKILRKVGTEAAGNSVHLGAAFKNGTDGGMAFGRPVDSVRENSLCDTIRGDYRLRTDDDSIRSAFTTGFNSTGIVPGTSASWNSTGLNQYTAFNTTHKATVDGIEWSYNPLTGFAMCAYTGTGILGRTLTHPMGKKLRMGWFKRLPTADDWAVYLHTLGATDITYLNLSNAAAANSAYWNDTEPTDTEITLGNRAEVNLNTEEYIFYGWFGDDLSDILGGLSGERGVSAQFHYTGGSGSIEINTGIDDIAIIMRKNSDNTGDWFWSNMKTMTKYRLNETAVENVEGQLSVEGSVISWPGDADSYEFAVFGSKADSGIDSDVILPSSVEDPTIVSMANGFNSQGNVDVMKQLTASQTLSVTGEAGQKFLYVQEDGTLGWTDIRPEYLRGYYPGVTGSHVYDIDKAVMYNASGYDKPIVQAWIEHPTYTGATIDGNDIWYQEADVTGAIRRALFYNAMEVGKIYRVRGRVTSFNETSGGTLYLPYTSGGSTPTQPNIGEFDYECTATNTTLSTQVSSDVYGHIIIDSIEEIITDEITPLVFIGECWLDNNGDVYDIRTYAKGDFWVSDLFEWAANTSFYFDLPFGHTELSMYLVGTNPSGVAEAQNYVEVGGYLRGAHNYYREDTLQIVTAQYPVSSSTYTDLKLYTRRNF